MKAERNHARLYRSSDDVVIAGVCAGVADYLGPVSYTHLRAHET